MDFFLIWLAFGFLGIVIIFFTGKQSLKSRFKKFNCPIAFVFIIGGLIIFIYAVLMAYWLFNDNMDIKSKKDEI